VNFVFQTYHVMITFGMLMIGMTLLAVFLLWRKRLFQQKWLLRFFVPAVLLPQIANQMGWYSAEVGRQPWIVYGMLRTSDGLSKSVTEDHLWFSLLLFTWVYVLLFALFIYLLNKKIVHGPDTEEEGTEDVPEYSKRFKD